MGVEGLMELVGAIIAGAFIGIIIGVLGKVVAPSTRNNLPLWLTIICGISAAIIGWLIYTAFITDTPGIDRIRWLITVVVAAILVVIANAIMARSRAKRPENEAKPSRAEEVGKVLSHKSQGIFLSYRREDAAPYARLLQHQLTERFPTTQVFLDLDSIEPGLPFARVIQDALSSSAVLVALIGRQWTTIVDEEGRRRLDKPDDYVRYEIQTALERGLRVVPVLVDGAKPLRQQDLPAQLQDLKRLNALELSYSRYEFDADRLLRTIERVLAAAPSSD
jgi:uncharacterized membrane protein YeaQ/YmgE (transglycosylase-associated protein family)